MGLGFRVYLLQRRALQAQKGNVQERGQRLQAVAVQKGHFHDEGAEGALAKGVGAVRLDLLHAEESLGSRDVSSQAPRAVLHVNTGAHAAPRQHSASTSARIWHHDNTLRQHRRARGTTTTLHVNTGAHAAPRQHSASTQARTWHHDNNPRQHRRARGITTTLHVNTGAHAAPRQQRRAKDCLKRIKHRVH